MHDSPLDDLEKRPHWRDRRPSPEDDFQSVPDTDEVLPEDETLEYSGRSVHCNECGYEGLPLSRVVTYNDPWPMMIGRWLLFLGGLLLFGLGLLFSRERAVEDSCPNCGANQFRLTRRRGPISAEAWDIYEAARHEVESELRARRRRIVLVLLGVIALIVAYIISLL